MGRLRMETLERVELFSDRMVDVAEALARQRRFARIIDQVAGCGTSVGANLFEADQAVSPKDFVKCMGVVVKELSECRFWQRMCVRRGWLKPRQMERLMLETEELLSMFNAMIVRSRVKINAPRPKSTKRT